MIRRLISLLAVAAFLALSPSRLEAVPPRKLVYQDQTVRVFQEYRFTINMHSGQPEVLYVGQDRFPWLVGSQPYYYEVGDGRSILFILYKTGAFNGRRTAVLYDLRTGKTRRLDLSNFLFGIFGRSTNPHLHDDLRVSRDGTIVLTAVSFDYREEIHVSLEPFRILSWRKTRAGKVVGEWHLQPGNSRSSSIPR